MSKKNKKEKDFIDNFNHETEEVETIVVSSPQFPKTVFVTQESNSIEDPLLTAETKVEELFAFHNAEEVQEIAIYELVKVKKFKLVRTAQEVK